MIKAVVFDMDGLLFDTERLYIKVLFKASEQIGRAVSEQFLISLLGLPGTASHKRYLETYGEDYPYEPMWERALVFLEQEIEKNGLPVKPGAHELLRYLKENQYQVGLATSTARSIAQAHLCKAGIAEYFQAIVCGDEIKNGKPAPDIYLEACRKLDVSSINAMALEDSFNGIRAAHAAGMLPVMIPDILQPPPKIEALLYAKRDRLDEVIRLLEETK